MTSEWPTVQLSDCAEFQEGYVNPSQRNSDFFDGPIKWLRAVDLNDSVVSDTTRTLSEKGFRSAGKSALLFEPGSLAISKSGTIGRLGILEDYMCGNRAVINIRVNHGICDKHYIFYVLKSKRAEIESLATGSVQKNLYTSVLGSMELDLPPLETQKAIASQLWSLDKKIQLNHQINQTLEQMAQAIFKSWFVDFEPVKAKIAALEAGGSEEDALLAAMQAISGKGEAELTRLQTEQPEQYAELRATAELFPSAMQESELGEIPAGWSVSPISDFGRIVCGKTPSKQKSEFYGGHIPFIKIPDMHGNMFATTTSDHLSPMGAASQPKKAIPKGSVCVSCIATVGQVVIATEESHTNQQINSIIPFEDNYTAYLYFRMESLYEHLHDLASGGSATLNLNTGSFSRIQILMPSDSILAGYAKSCTALLDRILCNMRESQSLSILRDTLLPKLLSGELSVPDVEDQLAEDAEPANV
ncbi:restriction endonuclease subunit S [Marinobacter hydrocarbonoclasticus]|uniref:restriction endonuclease subunit S n=1 Tax=Marinobacter nauticus TaxID=2743 RepID=UPI001C952A7F|nr:restriction endonuclease subunit S [Marinobacter nauticus]MBY6193899.1 restriction endonuclease subunit S [Marinobacter nauticus]MBY6215046.1 restriction endonuclease subunit S [Marinobacter nauticus]